MLGLALGGQSVLGQQPLDRAQTVTVDSGRISVAVRIEPALWRIFRDPENDLVVFCFGTPISYGRPEKPTEVRVEDSPSNIVRVFPNQHDARLRGSASAQFLIFTAKTDPVELSAATRPVADYLRQRHTLLVAQLLERPLRFRADSKHSVITETSALLKYAAPQLAIMGNGSYGHAGYMDESVLYVYLPPEFSRTGRFVVIAGREVRNPDLGHRSLLGFLDFLVAGLSVRPTPT